MKDWILEEKEERERERRVNKDGERILAEICTVM